MSCAGASDHERILPKGISFLVTNCIKINSGNGKCYVVCKFQQNFQDRIGFIFFDFPFLLSKF